MAPQELEKIVVELRDRQQISDCLARYSRGVDRLDRELLLSVYHPDAVDDHGVFCGTAEAFADYVIAMHRALHLSHQHSLFNHTCELAGDTAHVETYYMFVCINRTGPATSMSGGRYVDRMEKRQGEWKIAHRLCVRDWAALEERPDPADLSSFTALRASLSPGMKAFMNAGAAARRDRDDPSYLRPLPFDAERIAQWKRLQQP